jgi:hypothetical protein
MAPAPGGVVKRAWSTAAIKKRDGTGESVTKKSVNLMDESTKDVTNIAQSTMPNCSMTNRLDAAADKYPSKVLLNPFIPNGNPDMLSWINPTTPPMTQDCTLLL